MFAIAERVLMRIAGPMPAIPASAVDDVARLLQLQAERTPASIAEALHVSKQAMGPAWIREGADLIRSSPTRYQGTREALTLSTVIAKAGVRSIVGKFVHHRIRPYAEPYGIEAAVPSALRGSSYPSTHAAVAHAAAAHLELRGSAVQAARARAFADRVSLARQELGLHYPSDVEAGMAIGRSAARNGRP
jgi:hypothetical protein